MRHINIKEDKESRGKRFSGDDNTICSGLE